MQHSLMEIEQLFKKSWDNYKPRAGVLAGGMCVYVPVMLVLSAIAVCIGLFYSKGFNTTAPELMLTNFIPVIFVLGVIILAGLFIGPWISSYQYGVADSEIPVGFGVAIRLGFKNYARMLGLALVRFAMIVIPIAFVVGFFMILGHPVLAMIAGIVVGLLVGVAQQWFGFANVLIVRGMGVWEALVHSARITNTHWWGILFRRILAMVLISAVQLVGRIGLQMSLLFVARPILAIVLGIIFTVPLFLIYVFVCVPWLIMFNKTLFDDVTNSLTI